MKKMRKIILSLTIISLMSVGLGQFDTENYPQYIGGYIYPDTSSISVSKLLPPCDEGYTVIDGDCYYQSDLDILQQFIDNSQGGYMPPPSDMSPIDVGMQEWEDGRIVFLCYSYIGESECYIYDYILSGPIPPDIGNLVDLRHLILSWSQLDGQIPSSIGNLTNLTELKLHYNQLSGEIPPEIGNLTNLTDLYLRENELSGEIPPGIWNLVNLDRLFLEYNNLSGEIPESFSNLVNLRYCSFQHNQLSGQIPQSIGNFDIMIGLHLAHNQLSGMVPDGICNLVENSNFIYLYGNQLCPPYPECLSDEQINGPWLPGGGAENEQDTSECVDCPDSIEGDTNYSGEVNILDIILIVNCILSNDCDICSDLNFDDSVDILDIILMINIILTP